MSLTKFFEIKVKIFWVIMLFIVSVGIGGNLYVKLQSKKEIIELKDQKIEFLSKNLYAECLYGQDLGGTKDCKVLYSPGPE